MACSSPTVIDLGEWGEELRRKLGGRRYPFGCTFELTERCNQACVHCFINQPAASREAAGRELTREQVWNILDQVAEAGCLYVTLTGGEVFLRPDFLDIYEHARRLGLLVTVFTNGTLLTPAIADALAEWRPQAIELTMYGHSQETYERVTQTRGSHARFLDGVHMLVERRLPLGLKTVVLDVNRHELEAMKGFAASLGVAFRYDAMLWPRPDGIGSPTSHRLGIDEMVKLDTGDPSRLAEWHSLVEQFRGTATRAGRVFSCGAGVHGFHVDSAGKLSACMMAREPSYDLLEGTFRDGWDRFLELVVCAGSRLQTKCQTCSLGVLCDQCPGWSYLVHHDNETPVEFNCRLAHHRATALKLAQPQVQETRHE